MALARNLHFFQMRKMIKYETVCNEISTFTLFINIKEALPG